MIAVLATLVLGSQRCHPHCRIAGAYRLALGMGSLRLEVSNKASISVKILPFLLVFRGWEWVGIASLEMKCPIARQTAYTLIPRRLSFAL